jgi:hypothetical protein
MTCCTRSQASGLTWRRGQGRRITRASLASAQSLRTDRDRQVREWLFVAIGDNTQVTHVEPEDLQDLERIFIARTLRQARRVEELLTEAGVDYVVQVEPYSRSILFGTIRHGAGFYVAATHAAHCRKRLIGAGFGKGVVESDPTAQG